FYVVAFLFAGAAIALHFAIPGVSIGKGTVISGNRFAYTASLESMALLVAIPVSMALLRYSQQRFKEVRMKQAALVQITVSIGEHATTLTGLVDTGNQLRDPVSRDPVCLVEAHAIARLLPNVLQQAATSGGDLLQAVADIDDAAWLRRIALVPFRGAGGTQHLAVAIRPDSVTLQQADGAIPIATRCLFALQPNRVSVDGRFQAILHTELMTGDESFEGNWVTTQRQPEAAHPTPTAVDQDSLDFGGRS
ncbi:MAG: sigma-E processing peptidase SpoIIGA, partial [Alicyclobacillus sp.]|nr:sigma-E processing peptidase SpoIIGA [Alicyclobacillus sp.]